MIDLSIGSKQRLNKSKFLEANAHFVFLESETGFNTKMLSTWFFGLHRNPSTSIASTESSLSTTGNQRGPPISTGFLSNQFQPEMDAAWSNLEISNQVSLSFGFDADKNAAAF